MVNERSVIGFGEQIESIRNAAGRNAKKDIIADISEKSLWQQKIQILSGQRFDDIGIAKKTALKAVGRAFSTHSDEVADTVAEAGSVTEGVMEMDHNGIPETDALDELYTDIEELEDLRGDRQIARFAAMIEKYTEPWVVVFAVLDDMSIGVSHNTICSAVGKQYHFTKDEIQRGRALVPETVEFIRSVKQGEDVSEPTTREPFAPMKAKSIDAPDNLEDWVAQIKLDGYRCIIHIDGGDAYAYSSSMNNQSEKLPELDDIDWPDGEWIFDAEVMADDGKYSSTSERMQRKGTSKMPHTMNFWVFDLLVADGKDMTREPFSTRMNVLIEKAPMNERVIPVFAHDDIDEAREDALDNGYEGVILKHKGHEFEFGKRSKSWIKEKITTETVDLRVYGFQEGTGQNAGKLGALKIRTEDGVQLGKVGTGFTDEQRERIWDNRDDWANAIVEVQFDADEGYQDGLRFPSFIGRRGDKLQADDLDRVQNIAGDQ